MPLGLQVTQRRASPLRRHPAAEPFECCEVRFLDVRRELRWATAMQFWIFVLFVLVITAITERQGR